MNDRRTQSTFADIVSWRDIAAIQEYEQTWAMFLVAALKSIGIRVGQRLLEQPIAMVLNALHLRLKGFGRQPIALVIDMDGIAEQLLHGLSLKSRWRTVDHRLKIADLMGHTQLAFQGRSLQLGGQTVTAPDFGCMFCHNFPDHVFTTIIADHMQHRMQSTKYPLPPISAIQPAARLITVDHFTLGDICLDRFGFWDGFLPGPLHDLVNPTLADNHSVQFSQGRFRAQVADMLFLTVVHHG